MKATTLSTWPPLAAPGPTRLRIGCPASTRLCASRPAARDFASVPWRLVKVSESCKFLGAGDSAKSAAVARRGGVFTDKGEPCVKTSFCKLVSDVLSGKVLFNTVQFCQRHVASCSVCFVVLLFVAN